MYRGITRSPLLSKLFELALLNLFETHFTSDELQCGFTKVVVHMHYLLSMSLSDTSLVIRQKSMQPF